MTDMLKVASECRFAQADELTVALAARIWDLIEEATERQDPAGLVLSGGSTPVALYNVLRELPLPWHKMRVCLSDERWVGIDHEASNEAMLGRELLDADAGDVLISMARAGATPEEDADRVERELESISQPWDIVLLGMGNDGHTASLFPGASGLDAGLRSDRRCVAVEPVNAPEKRLSMTLRELTNSRRIILLLRGEQKWRVYREALAGTDVETMPVRAILQQNSVPVDVYWSAD